MTINWSFVLMLLVILYQEKVLMIDTSKSVHICFGKSGSDVGWCNSTLMLCNTGIAQNISIGVTFLQNQNDPPCKGFCNSVHKPTSNNIFGSLTEKCPEMICTMTDFMLPPPNSTNGNVHGLVNITYTCTINNKEIDEEADNITTNSPVTIVTSTDSQVTTTTPATTTLTSAITTSRPTTENNTVPNENSTVPNENSTVSTENSTEPTEGGTTQMTNRTTQIGDSTTPLAESTASITESTASIAESTTPIAESTISIAESTTPIVDSTNSKVESTTLLAESTTSIGDSTTQIRNSTGPTRPPSGLTVAQTNTAIAVSVVIPAIIAVVVIVVIMYRRGKCKLRLVKCTERYDKHFPEKTDAYAMCPTANADPNYDFSRDVDVNGCDVDYCEIDTVRTETDSKYSHVNLKMKQAVLDPTYSHIGHFNGSSGDTEQTYNHVGDETSQKTDSSTLQADTYSHIGAMTKPSSGKLVDNSYAHINGEIKNTSTCYDTKQDDVAILQLNGGPTRDFGNHVREMNSGKEKKFKVVGPSKVDVNNEAPVFHSYFILEKHEKEA